jgi:hypothetical protein
MDPHAFGAVDKEASGTVIVHFKVLAATADERLAFARVIERQLVGQRVGSKDVSYIITDEEVTTSLTDVGPLIAKIRADVLAGLGIKIK